jgi:hypothetical protein
MSSLYTPSASAVMLGRGALYFDRRTTTDNTVGTFHHGNCDTFGINVSTEKLTLSDFTQQSTSPYKEVVSSTTVALTIAGFEFTKDTMALATMGAIDATLAQNNTAVTGETLAAATVTGLKGKFFFTQYQNISSTALKQGATTHVLNTDYTLHDAVRGIIYIKTTGAVADGTALTIDYSKATITAGTYERVFGGTSATIEGTLRFISNNSTGPNWDCRVHNASLRPNGDISFISEEFNKFTLEGTAQSDATGTYGGSASSPYYTLTKLQ